MEVAVAYFRSGYMPKHFPTEKVGIFFSTIRSHGSVLSLMSRNAHWCRPNFDIATRTGSVPFKSKFYYLFPTLR